MSSAFKWAALGVVSLAAAAAVVVISDAAALRADAAHLAPTAPGSDVASGVLRVCADPNNMPFSNDRGEGFENDLAELVARDLGRRVEYVWRPQRRGFVRTSLKKGACDVIMGVPANFEMARPTSPYYRSTYVFVQRHDRRPAVRSLDDPQLKRMRIGIHMIGDDYANPPPAQALAMRGLAANVRGYTIYGDYSQPDPPRGLIDAVARGDIDLAIAWGPLAGYFAAREPAALDVTPVAPRSGGPFLPFVFDISMGVRRDDPALADELNREIGRRRDDIARLLGRYDVPMVVARTLEAPAPSLTAMEGGAPMAPAAQR
jgi:mxaJ protein